MQTIILYIVQSFNKPSIYSMSYLMRLLWIGLSLATIHLPRNGAKQVPILCYHNIKSSMEGHLPDYTIDRQQFRQHIKMLYDSGYHAITPEDLYKHITKGTLLPVKPIMITFDDNRREHYTIAASILRQYGFKGVFFIMTVTIGKPGYMNAIQIRELSENGHTIAAHTWDHPDVRKLTPQQWRVQLDLPRQLLEKITGKSVRFFAYPYGAWNEAAILQLKERGILAAFQLAGKQSGKYPLYTIRRLEVRGSWTPAKLQEKFRLTFDP